MILPVSGSKDSLPTKHETLASFFAERGLLGMTDVAREKNSGLRSVAPRDLHLGTHRQASGQCAETFPGAPHSWQPGLPGAMLPSAPAGWVAPASSLKVKSTRDL